jgi:pyruvate/2-oxoglutarate dehydrogenase complex dihydrolipoamide acyltransferase (E2) component
MPRYELIVPDLGLGDEPIVLSLWLAKRGQRVAAGSQLAEIAAACATVDLPSPVEGVLKEKLAAENDIVRVGQCLGIIEG